MKAKKVIDAILPLCIGMARSVSVLLYNANGMNSRDFSAKDSLSKK